MSPQKTEDQKPPFSLPPPPIPMTRWREAVLTQPEWPSLPDAIQSAILRRLRSTTYPTEPSGHTTWKHVKQMLQQGRQPDWVSLITATFIWRVRRNSSSSSNSRRHQRPDTLAAATALPDAFVSEAAFHDPPVDITSWPTRGGGVGALPKPEPGPLAQVKDEGGEAAGAAGDGVWVPGLGGGAREGRDGALGQQAEARPATTREKRARAGDEEEEASVRPQKKVDTLAARAGNGSQGAVNGGNEWETKFAAADSQLADAKDRIATLDDELAGAKERLAHAERKLGETTTELGELRAIAMGNRRIIRRIVRSLGEATRSEEQAVSWMGRELQSLEESIG